MDDRLATGPDGDAADGQHVHRVSVRRQVVNETVANGKLLRQLIRSGVESDVEVRPYYGRRIRGAIRYTEIGYAVE